MCACYRQDFLYVYIHYPQSRPVSCPPAETPVYRIYYMSVAQIAYSIGIAIVGSRSMTPHGAEACRYLTEGASRAGLTIISGLATGVACCP